MTKALIWIRDQLRVRTKAIAAGAAPWVVQLAAHYGAHVSIPTAVTTITAILAFVTTHELANTTPPKKPVPNPGGGIVTFTASSTNPGGGGGGFVRNVVIGGGGGGGAGAAVVVPTSPLAAPTPAAPTIPATPTTGA